ncbi:Uncharacterised protein [Sphingobacterium mizutaii]|uniref:Uncharacterized protein n=2 Tax=Sphingobacterium mizutaii TaxID=1010 RepID=A0AAJ4XC95_9SPHI|nr:hypothetical protein SAMN05192578_1011539 [Sphingobacterium mizutaii]SNV52284.1 Uncharacterised protein [Sphingobacterium mizutaii]
MTHANQNYPLVTQEISAKKRGAITQIIAPHSNKNEVHANKRSQVVSNVNTNYGFDKCGSFEEIAHLALHRIFNINGDGIAKANFSLNNRKELSVYFYQGVEFKAVHFLYGSNLGNSLEELNAAFLFYENLSKKGVSNA